MMCLLVPAVIVLIALAIPSTKADCSNPDWQPITTNPLKSGSNTIKSDPTIKLGAVQRLTGNHQYNGVKFMTIDARDGYEAIMGLWAPGDPDWTVIDGYTSDHFTDFYMFNANNTNSDMYLIYPDVDDMFMVTQQGDSTNWVDNTLIYTDFNGMRYPQAGLIDNNIYAAIQDVQTKQVTILYQGENDQSFTNYGVPILPDGSNFQPLGQFSMFAGYVDQSSVKTLWFYYIDSFLYIPYITYALTMDKGAIKLATPQVVDYLPVVNTTSVSSMASADGHEAVLFRMVMLEFDQQIEYAAYTVVQLTSGSIVATCAEQLLKWGPSAEKVPSVWAPALVTGGPFAGHHNVSLVWIDAQNGTLNALTGYPW